MLTQVCANQNAAAGIYFHFTNRACRLINEANKFLLFGEIFTLIRKIILLNHSINAKGLTIKSITNHLSTIQFLESNR